MQLLACANLFLNSIDQLSFFADFVFDLYAGYFFERSGQNIALIPVSFNVFGYGIDGPAFETGCSFFKPVEFGDSVFFAES